MDNVREIRTTLKIIMHCDVMSMISAYYSKQKFSRKKTIKRGGEISLHKHFKVQIHYRAGNGCTLDKELLTVYS